MPHRVLALRELQSLARSKSKWGTFVRCTLACLATLLLIYTQIYFDQWVQNRMLFVWFPAVFLSSAVWGALPGVFSLATCLIAAFVYYLPSVNFLSGENWPSVFEIIFFISACIYIIFENRKKTLLSQRLAVELLQNETSQGRLELLGNITEQSSDIVLVSDSQGKISYFNQKAAESLGLSDEVLKNRDLFIWDLFEAITPGDVKIEKASPYLLRAHRVQAGHLRPRHRVQTLTVSLTMSEVEIQRTRQRAFAFIFQDHSLEMELDRRIRIARSHLPMGLWAYDFQTEKYEASAEHDNILGVQVQEWSWDRLLEMVHPQDRPLVTRFLQDLRSGMIEVDFDLVYRVLNDDGQTRWVNSVGVIFKDHEGRVARVEGMVLNITAIKESEQHFKEAVELRDHFFAIASHELKTPISSLHLQLEVLRETIKQALRDRPQLAEDCFEVIRECTEQYNRLTKLVNDFLDVARIANGKLNLSRREISLMNLVDTTVRLFPPSSHVRLADDEQAAEKSDILVEADEERLRQVLVNLIANAVKFGLQRPVEVDFGFDPKKSEAWISVHDFGIGIDTKDIRRIFNEFEQASPGRETRGLGIGLYITREIVRAHSGRIEVDSKLGEGSTFKVYLPQRERPVVEDANLQLGALAS